MEPQITAPVSPALQIPPAPLQNKKSLLKFLGFWAVLIICTLSIAAAAIHVGAELFEYSDVYHKLAVETKRGFVEETQLVGYETPDWAIYVRAAGAVTGFPLTLIFLPFVGNDGAIGIGILLEKFDVPIVFLFWFIVLSSAWYMICHFHKTQTDHENFHESSKSYTWRKYAVLVVSVVIVAGLTFVKPALIKAVYQSVDIPSSNEPLVLSSITPDNGKEGDVITLHGSGFANKTLIVWLSDKKNNKYGFLWKGLPVDDSPISFPLKQSLCPTGFDPCEQSLKIFNKGEYVIKILSDEEVSAPFGVNEDVVIPNKQSIPISSFNQGNDGIGGRFKGGTLTVDAVEGSYVWIWKRIDNLKPVNYIEFNVAADAVNNFSLSAFIDNKQIGRVSTEFSGQKVQAFSAKIEELSVGSHTLSFRLDSFNWKNRLIDGSVTVSDVAIGYIAD